MRKRTFVGVIIVALVAALTAGGIFASNMGFKLNYRLEADPPQKDGKNLFALPYNRQAGIDTADDLMIDIPKANIASVERVLDNGTLETYTGRKGSPSPNFSLAAGEGYVLNMTTGTDYIVVGSHDPGLCVTLEADPPQRDGKQLYAPPYHQTSDTADAVLNDMVLANIASIERLMPNGTLETYTGRKGSPSPNFPTKPGESYVVNMLNTICYTPSHY